MKVILLTEPGGVTTMRLKPWTLFMALGLAVAAISAAAVELHARLAQHRQVSQAVLEWRSGIIDQQAAVASLQQQHTAENQAISKQLANMQARLWRMEALGEWVTQANGLEAGEFDFTAAPAQGGPESAVRPACAPAPLLPQGGSGLASAASPPLATCPERALPRSDLQARIDELAGQIRRREGEFERFEALLKAPESAIAHNPSGRPVKRGWVSSPYGHRIDPISGKMAWHAGVDFAGRRGSDVIAVDRGIVVFAGYRQGYGNLVELAHLDGHVTRYGHQGSIAVNRGDIVREGEVIGTIGTTGRATGPHVHFEVLKAGRHLEPMRYLQRRNG